MTPEKFHNNYIPEPNSGCFLWLGAANNEGYGHLYLDGVYFKAHRYAFLSHYGHLDENLVIMHSCDNPLCVNPIHLSQGTQADNSEDKHKKGRANVPLGEAAGTSILTEEEVKSIFLDKRYYYLIANEYNIGITTVSSIKTGITWTHITGLKRKKIFGPMKGKSRGEKNSQFGTMWITNGTSNKKIMKDSPIPFGWKRGRKIK